METGGTNRLGASELELLVELIATLHRPCDVSSFPQVALDVSRRAVAADIASFNDVDPTAAQFRYVIDPPDADAPVEDPLGTFARLAHHHPVIVHMQVTGDGSARRLSDFLTTGELHANLLYQHVFRPMGVEHQLAIGLPARRPRVIGIALSRSAASGDFSERDRLMLDALRPHLAQAYLLAAEREQLQVLLATGDGADAGRDVHVVLLTDPPRAVTPGAFQVLSAFHGAGTAAGDGAGEGDRLPDTVAAWATEQRRRVDHAAVTEVLAPLVTRADGRELLVRFVPGDLAPDSLVAEAVERASRPDALVALGLTPREAEVLGVVAEGATNAEVAVRLGMAPGTVKKHLDAVYRKLGVHGRMAAVALTRDLTARGLRRTGD